jgi:hypothetical protein
VTRKFGMRVQVAIKREQSRQLAIHLRTEIVGRKGQERAGQEWSKDTHDLDPSNKNLMALYGIFR